jgi:hypothetical protein
MHVVTVNSDRKICFVPITIGRDMGTQIEVLSGLQGSESLVTSPSDLLTEKDSPFVVPDFSHAAVRHLREAETLL